MGWASGGEVFEPVARKLIDLNVADHVKREVCSTLIDSLQNRGWDTEDESLGEFADDPAIVAAFREHGIVRHCLAEDGAADDWTECELERGHRGDHDDEHGRTWPKTGGNDD